jgi:transcriptional regulator with XRE-family HTH domain
LPVSETHVLRHLAGRIKALRRAKDWSQERLAERAAIQRSYLADLERGGRNPSVRTLVKIANALGVPASALLEEPARTGRERQSVGR